MQIFAVEDTPDASAIALCDRHIITQIRDTAELLAFAALRNGEPNGPFHSLKLRLSHMDHPCSVWVAKTGGNYMWTLALAIELCQEYTRRTGLEHPYEFDIRRLVYPPFPIMGITHMTPHPLVMPAIFVYPPSPMVSYQRYYHYKAETVPMCWTKRKPPTWFKSYMVSPAGHA